MRAFALFLLPGCIGTAFSQSVDNGEAFFETRIRPVLANNCFACHAGSQLGGLRLDSEAAMFKGGKSGPAIVAGDAASSLLMQTVRQTHSRLKMPPQGRLRPEELADLAAWIDRGAAWPRTAAAKPSATVQISGEQRAFWAFQPIRKPAVPHPRNGTSAQTNIDKLLSTLR